MSLAAVAKKGDRLKSLEGLRDRLAQELDDCASKRDVAALSQRFMDVLAQIAEIRGDAPAQPKETGLSEFEKRLQERESAPKASRRSSG